MLDAYDMQPIRISIGSMPCLWSRRVISANQLQHSRQRLPRMREAELDDDELRSLEGNICALQATKDHVDVFVYDGAIVPDPEGIITSGYDNKSARTVAMHQGERITAGALSAMFKQIIANNHAGGWRKLKKT
jgi:hypothetical protein